MRILIATDGSSHSEEAARTLVALGPPSDSELFVVHVVETPRYLVTPTVPPTYLAEWHRVQRETQDELAQAAERAIEQAEQIYSAAGFAARSMIRDGHPADEILGAAEEIGADLVVVGSKGLTGGSLFLLGSVSQRVMKYAKCSVLLTKPMKRDAAPKVEKIVLATDGSDNALEAARFVSLFRLADDVEIAVLNVMDRFPARLDARLPRSGADQIRRMMLENAEGIVRDTQDNIRSGAKVTAVVREGDAAEEVLRAGSEMDADLIVVGSKGLSGIKLFLLGSVSQRVCRYSDRSAMLVKMRQ